MGAVPMASQNSPVPMASQSSPVHMASQNSPVSMAIQTSPAGPEEPSRVMLVILLCLVATVEASGLGLWDLMIARLAAEKEPTIDVAVAGTVRGVLYMVGGLFWGILVSQERLTRKQLLVLATVVHGLVAIVAPM